MDTERLKYLAVIVDDGSTNGSLQEIEKIGIESCHVNTVRHQKRRGLGAAIRTGLHEVIRVAGKEDMIVIMDADNTHNPTYVPQMMKEIKDSDIVIASRYSSGGRQLGLRLHRKITSNVANMILRRLFPIRGIREYTSSFRLYRAEIIRKAAQFCGDRLVESDGFTCMTEILIKLHRYGASMVEIPFVADYSRKKGRSKLPVVKTVVQYIILMTKMIVKKVQN